LMSPMMETDVPARSFALAPSTTTDGSTELHAGPENGGGQPVVVVVVAAVVVVVPVGVVLPVVDVVGKVGVVLPVVGADVVVVDGAISQ
jgi:hypothetical protein